MLGSQSVEYMLFLESQRLAFNLCGNLIMRETTTKPTEVIAILYCSTQVRVKNKLEGLSEQFVKYSIGIW